MSLYLMKCCAGNGRVIYTSRYCVLLILCFASRVNDPGNHSFTATDTLICVLLATGAQRDFAATVLLVEVVTL